MSSPPPDEGPTSSRRHLVIGSRKSDLAQWQARAVKAALEAAHPGYSFEIQTELASGDTILDTHLATLASANPGVFTKELETGLLSLAYDLAVHSLKDMPTALPPGLMLAGVTERDDPRDAVVLSAHHGGGRHINVVSGNPLATLPRGSVVGTSSLRREAFLRRSYPHLLVRSIRGNLNTRLRKLDEEPLVAGGAVAVAAASVGDGDGCGALPSGEPLACDPQQQHYDAIVLAAAGLKRMGWAHRISAALPLAEQPYAVGQGALGIECRSDDELVRRLVRGIVHPRTQVATAAERAFLNQLQGGCQVPIAVHCYLDGGPGGGSLAWDGPAAAGATEPAPGSEGGPLAGTLSLTCVVLSLDGSQEVTAAGSAPVHLFPGGPSLTEEQWGRLMEEGAALGRAVAAKALRAGAGDILGPLIAARPATYGSAELPLDR